MNSTASKQTSFFVTGRYYGGLPCPISSSNSNQSSFWCNCALDTYLYVLVETLTLSCLNCHSFRWIYPNGCIQSALWYSSSIYHTNILVAFRYFVNKILRVIWPLVLQKVLHDGYKQPPFIWFNDNHMSYFLSLILVLAVFSDSWTITNSDFYPRYEWGTYSFFLSDYQFFSNWSLFLIPVLIFGLVMS